MRALIIAAGRGSRLGPHTEARPKCLLPFAGRTLLDWQRRALAAAGIAEVALVRGYLGHLFEGLGLELRENPDWARTNMVASLFRARDLLCRAEPLVVAYGDILYEPRVLAALLASEADIAVAVDRNWRAYWELRNDDPLADAESLRLDDGGAIVDIGRKVADIAEIEAQYIGLMRFSPAGLARLLAFWDAAGTREPWMLGRDKANCQMTDLLRGLIEAGVPVTAAPFAGGWLEFDTVGDLALYETLATEGRLAPFFDTGWGA